MKTFSKKRIISFIAALAMIITSLAAVTVSAAPDLTQDFVKTFKESDSTAQAADSLVKTKPGEDGAYMIRSSNDHNGRNSLFVEASDYNTPDLIYFDGGHGPSLKIVKHNSAPADTTDDKLAANGASIKTFDSTSATPRAWVDVSSLGKNEYVVVSAYAKTENPGETTKFNIAFNSNTVTDTYGRDGMETDNTWKKFAGVITTESFANGEFNLGFARNTLMKNINISCFYVAKAKAVDIKTDIDSAVAAPGDTLNASAEILNQVGTTGGVSQDVTWYITDETRANIITDGITVSADGKITVSDAAENGTYYAVAVANADETMVSGKAFQVKGGAINVSKDFVKTFKESNSTAQAADSLIRTKDAWGSYPAQPQAYMLRGGNDIPGRNSGDIESNVDNGITLFDGTTGSAVNIIPGTTGVSGSTNTVYGITVAGQENTAAPTPRAWFDKSTLKDNDKIVVSVYVKASNSGEKTKFTLGILNNSQPAYGYNVFTDTYGREGMDVTDTWKKFSGVITIPKGFESASMSTKDWYTFQMGYPQNTTEAKINVSCIYAAKAKAVDINASLSKDTAQPGDTLTASAEILNQVGTTAGVSQDVNWYVANEDRSEVLTDSGITVSEDGTVSIADSAEKGTYYIVAMSANNRKMLKGAKLLVEGKGCSINLTKTGNGSVSYEKADGTSVTLADGANTVEGGNSAFTFTPDEGYEITSIEFGGASIPISDKHGFSSILTIDGTKELKVTFSVRSPEAPSVSSEDPIFVANYDYTHLVQGAAPSNAILGYATLDLGYGNTISECGYILANESGKTVTLPSYVIPSGGGKYGIRAVGAALTAGVYKFTPYVKLADNTVIYGTEKTVTIS